MKPQEFYVHLRSITQFQPIYSFSLVETDKRETVGVLNLWEMIQQQVLNKENHKNYYLILNTQD